MSETRDSSVELYALSCPDSGEVRYVGKARDSKTTALHHVLVAKWPQRYGVCV